MKFLLSFVICSAMSLPGFAQEVEAMRHGNAQAEAAAQARVEARAKVPVSRALQPEAQRSFNERAAAVAEARKAQRLQGPRHPADQSRVIQQYRRL